LENNHRIFQVKPDFISFTSIAFVIGLCGGLVWGVIAAAKMLFAGQPANEWYWSIVVLVITPVLNAISFALSAAVGYPIFKRWRRNSRGIRIEGSYVALDEHNQEVGS